jgi:hypothetical protein
MISELERNREEVLWPSQYNIQELAWRVTLKLKFSAIGVIDTYRVIGGIIHSFVNLAFPGYDWSGLRPGLFYSCARNRIHLEEEEVGWTWKV